MLTGPGDAHERAFCIVDGLLLPTPVMKASAEGYLLLVAIDLFRAFGLGRAAKGRAV